MVGQGKEWYSCVALLEAGPRLHTSQTQLSNMTSGKTVKQIQVFFHLHFFFLPEPLIFNMLFHLHVLMNCSLFF